MGERESPDGYVPVVSLSLIRDIVLNISGLILDGCYLNFNKCYKQGASCRLDFLASKFIIYLLEVRHTLRIFWDAYNWDTIVLHFSSFGSRVTGQGIHKVRSNFVLLFLSG